MSESQKVVLLTGFDAFGGEAVNPSELAVRDVCERGIERANVRVVYTTLPTSYDRCAAVVRERMLHYQPSVVIAVGQAGGRSTISIERVAINVDDTEAPDNDGVKRVDQPILVDGPCAYFSSLPIQDILARLHGAGIPAGVSNSAGTYVCNHLFYLLMHEVHTAAPALRAGFIHVPYIPSQTLRRQAPSMPLEMIITGIRLAAEATLDALIEQEEAM